MPSASPVFSSGGGPTAAASAPERETSLDSTFEGATGEGAEGSEEDEEEYEVERVLDERPGKYLVKWKGFPIAEATWEDVTSCDGCLDLVAKFRRAQAAAAGAAAAAAVQAAAAAAPAAAAVAGAAAAEAPTLPAAPAAAAAAPARVPAVWEAAVTTRRTPHDNVMSVQGG